MAQIRSMIANINAQKKNTAANLHRNTDIYKIAGQITSTTRTD